ncbi:MAG: zinc ABC transporter solute-binding protein [Merismopedia sp. SIO2A8]|nr:zinc ABC transporter solute-binding protein [Symploca sp. SIO2B6]NET49478.1 zinc ABC transporter solute-binding protein [Merismopedia sp. SIO2A8]
MQLFKYLIAAGSLVFTVGLTGCDTPLEQEETGDAGLLSANSRPSVVATSTIIADLADQVGGEAIALTSILEAGADPHVYEPVPQDSIAFEEADLILYNGHNLEPALIKMANAAGIEATAVAVAEGNLAMVLNDGEHQEPDPHVWGNVENAIVMTTTIRDALITVSPDNTATFTQNAAELTRELTQLHQWIGEQILTIPPGQRQLVTTHDAFAYYAEAYDLEVLGTLIGISTEEQPSAQTLQGLVDSVKAAGVPTLFAETTINPRLITTVAEEAGVQLAEQELYSDSIGAVGTGGDSYTKMMISNTQAIVNNLGGSSTPFELN